MTRVHLAQLLRDLTSAHDYAFFSAPDEYMPSEIDRYPAAWLAPVSYTHLMLPTT